MTKNRLQRLADRIADLPNQDALRQKKVQLTTIANRAEGSLEEVRDAKQRVVALRAVLEQPQLLVDLIGKQLLTIKRRAQTLSTLVRSADAPDAAKVSVPLQGVTDAARVLREAVESEWAAASDVELASAQAFVALAGTYDVTIQRGLQSALDRFRKSVKSPPTTADAMVEYRASRNALIAARDAMQITGPIADFLLAAVKGVGDARAIRNDQVRDFLNQHPVLWERLRVGLT